MNHSLRTQVMSQMFDNANEIQGKVEPITPDLSDDRAFELSTMLQTTLDLDQQLELFAHELRLALQIDSVCYQNEDMNIHFESGNITGQRANYDLVVHQENLGRMQFNRDLPFEPNDLVSLENLLCVLIYPLRNALRYRQALDQALRDPLTGVQNRSALQTTLEREFDLARRQDVPLSVIVMDIDHFKHFNDNYGHSFGDDVLKAVTGSADSTIRRCDLLFRYGGEEFVIIASHTDREGAELLAERIRLNIEALGSVSGREVCITASMGVAQVNADDSPASLFDRADKALYEAKHQGRNQTVSA